MNRRKILAVSSGGGHWIELLRLQKAFVGHDVEYLTVRADYRDGVRGEKFHLVNDATSWNLWGSLILMLRTGWVLFKVRPEVIISTGAAPGYFALRWGKLLGCQTVWLDSLANVEELSRAGKMAGPYADLWLTQWPNLANSRGPHYKGQVL